MPKIPAETLPEKIYTDGVSDELMALAATSIEEHLLPQKSKERYGQYLEEFENWGKQYELQKDQTDGKVMMAYFAYLIDKYAISTVMTRFSSLKRMMVAKGVFSLFI